MIIPTGIAYCALFPENSHCQYYPEHLAAAATSVKQAISPDTAVEVHDFSHRPLQLQGDIIRQQLVCYFPD